MSVKKILTEPNKLLRQVSKPVEKVGDEEKTLMKDMLDTMYAAPGIGLAAIQVGVAKRIIVLDLGQKEGEKKPFFFVNPEIIDKSENNSIYEEGCLSVPGQFAEIERPDKCHIKFLNYHGEKEEMHAEGMLATCIQHEVDHLNGILFIDYLSKLKKDMIIKKLVKHKKEIERIIV